MSENGTQRAVFLRRVSDALGRQVTTAPAAPPPSVSDAVMRTVSPGQDLPTLFTGRATGVGMVVHRCNTAEAMPLVFALLRTLGARRVAVTDAKVVADIAAALEGGGFEIVDWHAATGLEPLYDADVGITDVQAAIAETGSLVCCSGPGRGRGLSLVPPLHIAVVRVSDIRPDLIDYWARHQSAPDTKLPSSIVLITGPSKTADIEGELITGVHGPREVHVVLIEDA